MSILTRELAELTGGISPAPPMLAIDERRRFRRLPLTLLGRFMRANKQEFPCRLIDISVGGLSLHAPVEVELGERIVAYIDEVGGLEGYVTRRFENGFSIRVETTPGRRERLAATLTYLANRAELDPSDLRRHERFEGLSSSSKLKLPTGTVRDVRILDISLSGASVGCDLKPEIGTEIQLGKLRARVVRHHGEGFGVRFLDIQKPEALKRSLG